MNGATRKNNSDYQPYGADETIEADAVILSQIPEAYQPTTDIMKRQLYKIPYEMITKWLIQKKVKWKL